MPSHTYSLIAREGWLLLATLIILYLVLLQYMPTLSYVVLFSIAFIVFLLRDPHRLIPADPLGVVSPVHGRITIIDKIHSERLDCQVQRVRIKMSMLDIYSLRSPTEGKLVEQWAGLDEEDGKYYDFLIQTDEGDKVLTHILYRNKHCSKIYLQSGERIGQGKRCGYLCLGAQVDVLLQDDFALDVKVGDKLISGSSVLGHLVHNQAVSAVV